MPPQTSRYPTPAAGDAVEPGGRHRRPESLADLRTAEARLADARGRGVRASGVRVAVVGADRADQADRSATPSQHGGTAGTARHQRTVRAGRHAAPRRATSRPPVTGSHRAPGTLPIESWLLLGKTRQQVLLASLVAVGMLLFAVPDDRRQEGVDAVDAAAQRAAGVSAPKTRPATEPPAAGRAAEQPREKDDDPEPAPPAATPPPAGASAAPVVTPTRRPDDGLGPGRSLRFTGSRTVALTFDDGPDPVHTPRILATLGQHRVRATFCLVGVQVERHPDIVRQIADAGHALCNHTWDHSLTIGKDKPEEIRADLDRTDAAIRAAVPGARIPFFRAPGGNFTDRLVTVAGEAGMTSLYWDVDPRDWEHPVGESPEAHIDRLVAEVRRTVRPGAIVLSHDFNQPGTVAAYEKLLPWLTERFRLGIPTVRRPEPAPSTPPAPSPSSPAATTAPPPQG